MKITLAELKARGPLQKLAIRSADLCLYLAEVELDGDRYLICEEDGSPLRTANLAAMREKLMALGVAELVLVQESAYDEMIGQPGREGSNKLEVPLGLDPQSPVKVGESTPAGGRPGPPSDVPS